MALQTGDRAPEIRSAGFQLSKLKGKLILRFDDTNPELEKEEFQEAIKEDLARLDIKPDEITYTSDYFQDLYEYCVQMIKSGFAYADDTEQEVMKKERREGFIVTRASRPC